LAIFFDGICHAEMPVQHSNLIITNTADLRLNVYFL
jgi:hypothetical protein